MMLQKKFLMSLMAGSEMGEDGNQLNAEQELRWGAKMRMLMEWADRCYRNAKDWKDTEQYQHHNTPSNLWQLVRSL